MDTENPYKKYESLFEGWPWVKAEDVCGAPGMKVSGWHDTPDSLKSAHAWAVFINILWAAGIGFCYHAAFHHLRHHAWLWAGGAFVVWGVLAIASHIVLEVRMTKGTAVRFSPAHIKIGEKVYDARVQHKFSMELHRQAKEEADAELRAQQSDPKHADTRHPKYYRDAFHIHFEYLGQKILVTDISKEETAEKFLRALSAVDRIIHKENTVYSASAEAPAEAAAETRQAEYFGKRPALD